MTGPAARRGFLRGLVSLPLIGGGVTLIGAPSAVAEPITDELLLNYETWLNVEVYRVATELHPGYPGAYSTLSTPAWAWHEADRPVSLPSTRAALVLAAVGCNWREGRR